MANTYTWHFTQLDTASNEGALNNVVKGIHWCVTGQSDVKTPNNKTDIYGQVNIAEANPASFTAFNSLTEDWCKTQVLAHIPQTEAELKAAIDSMLTKLDNPTIVGKLPSSWE
jgi:hypothetical protein